MAGRPSGPEVPKPPFFTLDPDGDGETVETPDQVANTIDDLSWNSITVTTPAVPVFTFPTPPNVTEPDTVEKPELDELDIPDQEFFDVADVPKTGEHIPVEIPTGVTLQQWTEIPPEFKDLPPAANIDWKWEDFSTEFRALLTTRFADLSVPSNVSANAVSLNDAIFKRQEELTSRGWAEKDSSRADANFKRQKELFNSLKRVSDLEADHAFKQLEITQRQENERILRDQYKAQKDLELAFAKAIAENGIADYNACVQRYNAQVRGYAMLAEEYQNKIALKQLKLEKMQAQLGVAQQVSAWNAAYVQTFEAEAQAQMALARLFKSEFDVAKRVLQLELLKLELFEVEIQAFVAESRGLERQAQQKEIEAEADAQIAESTIASSLQKELQARIDRAEVELEAARETFEAERDTYEALEGALNTKITSFISQLDPQEDLVNAELDRKYHGGLLDKANSELDIRSDHTDREDRDLLNESDVRRLLRNAVARERIANREAGRDRAMEDARRTIERADIAAVREFAKAKIRNTVIRQLSSG